MFQNELDLEKFIKMVFPFVVILSYKEFFYSRQLNSKDRKKFIEFKYNQMLSKNSLEKPILNYSIGKNIK